VVGTPDVITHENFGDDQIRGLGAAGEWQIYVDLAANRELLDDVTTSWHATED